jgi:hypothetical protein
MSIYGDKLTVVTMWSSVEEKTGVDVTMPVDNLFIIPQDALIFTDDNGDIPIDDLENITTGNI